MLHVTAAGWAATFAAIGCLLAIDWLVLGRRAHAVGLGEAARWSAFYIAVACAFGLVFGAVAGWGLAGQYFVGYVVEKSLSVDNLFVFVLIIGAFAVPAAQQPKALSIGIVIALALRGVLIALGAALLSAFSAMFLVFGVMLVGTAVQLFRHRDRDPSVDDNFLVAAARRVLPVSSDYDEGRLVTHRGGRRSFTPLLLALLAIGTTDVLFAVDSIPAVFGVTRHPYIVFAANAFALLGLRALFFLVSGLLDRLVYLSTGLSVILAFIGIKLILHFAHHEDASYPEISTVVSFAVIVAVLAVTTIASLRRARREPGIRAHAGSLRGHEPARREAEL
jgi:tellurite resistance protein TerC